MSFDPDAFLAEQAAAAAPAATTFDPDAFLAGQAATAAPAFDPDAFLAEQTATTAPDTVTREEQNTRSADTTANVRRRALEIFEQDNGRPATESERAKIYQMDAEARGDTATAQKLSRDRANLDVAKLDEKTAEGQVAAVRAPYVFVRGVTGGITLGASDIALRKIEESAIGKPVQAESMSESMGEGVGRLLGSIFTGGSIASGMAKPGATGSLVKASELGGGLTALIAKTGARPFAQLVATSAATSLATMAPQEAASVINGDKPIPDAIRDTAINVLASMFGRVPEIFVKAGVPNFLAQVTGQVAFDAATDALVTGRLTKDTYKEWMINEIPNLTTALIFASKDLTDKDFATHQGKYRKDFVDMFTSKVKEQAVKKPFEYGPNVEEENAKRALKTHEETKNAIKESYPLDTHENVIAAITDLSLVPELTALHEELDRIRLELKAGERVAGRIPQKNERGEIIGWMNSGAAYPGGMGADTIPAIRNYLDGKPLTENQQRQLATAVKHSINELSGQAGFDIANQNPVYAEDMRPGDQIALSGEKFTVKEVDPDTGNITLKDGKLVTLKAGETILADRNSHVDVDGKAPGQRESAPFNPDTFLREQEAERAPGDPTKATDEDVSFNPDEFLAERAQEPVRHDLGDGISAEQTPEGHWEITDADGNRSRLDPTVAEDHALIQQIDPDKRAAEVKRIATETAEKLPGAKIHFIDDEAAMNEVRANLGEAVKEIRAEDGTVRGFAVVGSNDYFILTRNMYPGEAARTVIHEAVGHIGVQGVLGDRIDTVLDGIYSSKTEHKATLERIAKDYGLDLTTKKGQREATEELIAHIAERRDKDPGAWKRLVARFKDYFRQMGFEWAKDWTDNDIAALIERGRDRVSKSPSAIKSDINTGIRKAMTYATGNWDDAPRQQKVFENSSRRVYEVIRQGKTIYETVAKEGGKWKTVMYSDNIPEARDANFKKPEISRETSARKLLWYSIGQPWYARAIRSGLSPAEIFSSHTEIVKLIEHGADAAPAVKLPESATPEYYNSKQPTEDLPIAAETGIRLSRAPQKNPLSLFTSTHNLSELRQAKDEWIRNGRTEENAGQIVSRYYKKDSYSQLKGQNPILVTVPSTSGRNLLPIMLANKLASDFGGQHFTEPLAVSGAIKESKNKTGFWAKLDDPVSYAADESVIQHLKETSNGKPIWIVEDIHNTGESWMRFKQLLEKSGIPVKGVLTLGASDFRMTSPRDLERLSQKLSKTLNIPIDEISRVVQNEFNESPKQWFNYAERAASGSTQQADRLWAALRSRASTSDSQNPAITGTRESGETPGGKPGDTSAIINPELRLAKNSSGLTQSDRDMLLKSAKQRLYGRPDLSQVTTSKQTRALVAEVDQSRNEKGQPTPQTFKSWKENADTRMQKDTTGEWLQFLSGKMHYEGDDAGQNTMVARKLLESKGLEAFASGDDAEIAKVGAAIWGYRNTRSNLARALAAGRDYLETPAERNRRWIAEALYYPGAKVDRKLQGMDLKSMQAELQKRAGKMQEIRTKLLDMGIDLAKLDEKTLNDPSAMAEIVRQIQISNAGYGDMFYEYWRNGILSALPTHAANISGNTMSIAWNYTAQKWTEALINGITRSKTGTSFGELPGMYRTLWGSKLQAARNAMAAFSTEQGSIEGIRLEEKGVAIPGTAGRIIRIPQRALLAADEFSKTMILQAELYSRAHQEAHAKGWRGDGLERRIKEILADPKSDMLEGAIDEAKHLTFQAEPGEITSWVMKSRTIPGFQWISKYVLPFVTTPTNIVKIGIRKTPLGLLRMAKEAAQGNYKGNREALVRDSAEQMLAMATTFALISLVSDEDESGIPRITGSGPSGGKDAGKQQAEQRMHPAQSIRLGDRWYSYSRIEPLATAITHTIDVIEAIKNKGGEDSAEQMGRIMSSMKSLARDKTFLATIGDIIRATEDDSKGISLVQNFTSSWIPNFIRSGARATDPYFRSAKVMTRDDKNTAQELAANIGQTALPLASVQDAPRMDFWGRPLQKSEGFGPATDIMWRLVSPMTVQHAHEPDNFDRMLFNYNRKATAKGWEAYWPAMPGNGFELPGARGIERTARMNPDEYSRFLKRRGDFFFEQAAGTVWKFDDPSTMEIAQFKKYMSKATLLAKNDIYQERKMNPASKDLKLLKEAQRPRPQVKPLPQTRPMMNLDESRRSL